MENDGTKFMDVSYWETKCLELPADVEYIAVVMGDLTDYFRPSEIKGGGLGAWFV